MSLFLSSNFEGYTYAGVDKGLELYNTLFFAHWKFSAFLISVSDYHVSARLVGLYLAALFFCSFSLLSFVLIPYLFFYTDTGNRVQKI